VRMDGQSSTPISRGALAETCPFSGVHRAGLMRFGTYCAYYDLVHRQLEGRAKSATDAVLDRQQEIHPVPASQFGLYQIAVYPAP
jgi:hypothetical protein